MLEDDEPHFVKKNSPNSRLAAFGWKSRIAIA
jgi:hypothetical protein